MNRENLILSTAKTVIEQEYKAIQNLSNLLTPDFEKAVQGIYESSGRLIVTGVGKSAHIAQKMVATFNSTGTPAIFMHAADAIHGDLGIILKDDMVLVISKSGNTPEIKVLVPLIRLRENKIIALTGNIDSYLAQQADFVIDVTVDREACPNNLAPTTSTTAQLVMGDAIAVSLLELRGFSTDDFAKVHPGGALGKMLYLTAEDIYTHNEKPQVKTDTPMAEVIVEMTSKRLGATAVLEDHKIAGMITDGDLRRMIQREQNYTHLKAADIMNKHPKTISHDTLLVDALHMMRSNNITQVLVTQNDQYVGVIHIHDILKEGII